MVQLFDFSFKKTFIEILFIYIITVITAVIIAFLFGSALGIIGLTKYSFLVGATIAAIINCGISYSIYDKRELSDLMKLFLVVSIVITLVLGIFIGFLLTSIIIGLSNNSLEEKKS